MKILQKTFYEWQYDDIKDIVTLEVTAEEFLKRANERLECQTLEDIDAETEEYVWDEMSSEWEKEQASIEEEKEDYKVYAYNH